MVNGKASTIVISVLVETITSAYDKMSEIDAFNILKKKILKGEPSFNPQELAYVQTNQFLSIL